jgi:hypothetical protein
VQHLIQPANRAAALLHWTTGPLVEAVLNDSDAAATGWQRASITVALVELDMYASLPRMHTWGPLKPFVLVDGGIMSASYSIACALVLLPAVVVPQATAAGVCSLLLHVRTVRAHLHYIAVSACTCIQHKHTEWANRYGCVFCFLCTQLHLWMVLFFYATQYSMSSGNSIVSKYGQHEAHVVAQQYMLWTHLKGWPLCLLVCCCFRTRWLML